MAGVAQPYASNEEHLADHGVLSLLLLRRYLLRHWHRLTDASGNLSDVYVGLHEALAALGVPQPGGEAPAGPGAPGTAAGLEQLATDLASWRRHIGARVRATVAIPLPLEHLRAAFRLSALEIDVLVVLFRAQTDLDFSRLCTFAWADFTRKQPDVAFLVDLLAAGAEERAEVVRALLAEGRLVRHRLVQLHDGGAWQPETPHLFQRLLLPHRVLRLMAGDAQAEPPAAAWRRIEGTVRADELCLEARCFEQAVTAVGQATAEGNGATIVALYGPPSVGKTTLATAVAAARGAALLFVEFEPLWADPPQALEDAVAEAVREAMVMGALLFLALGEGPPGDDLAARRALSALARALSVVDGPVIVSATQPQPWLTDLGPVLEIPIAYTSHEDQQRAWELALANSAVYLDGDIDPAYLANRFNLAAGLICRAVEEAAALGTLSESEAGEQVVVVSEGQIIAAARKHVRRRMGALATPVHTSRDWSDLVLPPELRHQLAEIQAMVQHQSVVYREWGLGRLADDRRGLAVLFSGPPGTGKTLAASLLGKSLGLEVYRIDLSRVVDKYIGETEKNLARLFDQSEHAPVLLLFDEADSLFAKRTEVRSSHDRYANLEVNFLLQRIESFEGVCILTTNHEPAIDEAFKRRLRYRLTFPQPDAAAREGLWRAMLSSASARVEAGVPWKQLAAEFNLSGGHIRNAVLRAAFRAAAEGGAIRYQHLRESAATEARELGQLVSERTPEARRS